MSYALRRVPPARVRPFSRVDARASGPWPSPAEPPAGALDERAHGLDSPRSGAPFGEEAGPDWAGSGTRRKAGELIVVGYIERVALPVWGMTGLAAKIDTGAETSALHVENLRESSATRVVFEVAANDEDELLVVEARVVRRGLVRSSNGHTEERVFVRTALTLGGRSQNIEIGLVDRSQMEYRMLVGRAALAGIFLVDPGRLTT